MRARRIPVDAVDSPTASQVSDDARLLTVREYARRKRVCEETVRRWIRGGKVLAERVGTHGDWRIKIVA